MLSIPVVPYVADMAGRRAGVVTGCIIMLFGVAMVSIGYHIALFVVGRIVLGFGLGIAQVSLNLLCLSLSQLLTAERNVLLCLSPNWFTLSTERSTVPFIIPFGMWEA